jgi:hypothetical protein
MIIKRSQFSPKRAKLKVLLFIVIFLYNSVLDNINSMTHSYILVTFFNLCSFVIITINRSIPILSSEGSMPNSHHDDGDARGRRGHDGSPMVS